MKRLSWTALVSLHAALAFGVTLSTGADEPAPPREPRILRAAQATYIHGMTEEIARAEVGADGLPVIRTLLLDPTFPRRDNLVAFLDALGGPADRDALLAFLDSPPASLSIPEEERGLLLAPQALGRIAHRGDQEALAALLSMTAHNSDGGVLGRAASAAPRPERMLEDLTAMALRGLALSGAPQARARLEDISDGAVIPSPAREKTQREAWRALLLFEELWGLPGGGQPTPATDGPGDPPADAAGAYGSLDLQTRVHRAGIAYANHAQLSSPMTDARLDDVLELASLRAGRGDFPEDIACCSTVTRSGAAKTFGATDDGLDSIDDDAEMRAVLNNPTARVKVVRSINYCGGPGTNIIGCAWRGGNGMALVRVSSLGSEGVLWLHEYGHNTGLTHNASSTRFVMYGVDYGTNDGLNQAECNAYHSPATGAAMSVVDIGACTDNDGDLVHDVLDNCPGSANASQADADGDGLGDPCDTGSGPFCGNGLLETGEACDGADFGGKSCQSQGFDGGALSCNGDCTLNTSGCTCADADGDGYTRCSGDCNDSNASIHPGAAEICNDGVDQDCSGRDKTRGCTGAAKEICTNGVDDDRDGFVDCADPDCRTRRVCR